LEQETLFQQLFTIEDSAVLGKSPLAKVSYFPLVGFQVVKIYDKQILPSQKYFHSALKTKVLSFRGNFTRNSTFLGGKSPLASFELSCLFPPIARLFSSCKPPERNHLIVLLVDIFVVVSLFQGFLL